MIKAEVERQFILKHDVTLDASRVGSLEFEHDERMTIAVPDLFNAEDTNHLSVAPLLNCAEAFVRQVDMHVAIGAAQSLVFLCLSEPIILIVRVIWSAVQGSAPRHCLSLYKLVVGIEHLFLQKHVISLKLTK